MLKHKLVDFIIQFMEEVDKEISEMKLFVCFTRLLYFRLLSCANKLIQLHMQLNARARFVAESFLTPVCTLVAHVYNSLMEIPSSTSGKDSSPGYHENRLTVDVGLLEIFSCTDYTLYRQFEFINVPVCIVQCFLPFRMLACAGQHHTNTFERPKLSTLALS